MRIQSCLTILLRIVATRASAWAIFTGQRPSEDDFGGRQILSRLEVTVHRCPQSLAAPRSPSPRSPLSLRHLRAVKVAAFLQMLCSRSPMDALWRRAPCNKCQWCLRLMVRRWNCKTSRSLPNAFKRSLNLKQGLSLRHPQISKLHPATASW